MSGTRSRINSTDEQDHNGNITYDQFLGTKIKEFSVFTGQFQDAGCDFPILSPNAERIFRSIEAMPSQPDFSLQLRNLRVDKIKLKKYLSQRYSPKIATKMVSLFDFNMPLDYRTFYRQLLESIVDQEKSQMEIYESARQFVFQIYDINSDNCLEQCDLFSYIKEVKNEETFT